MGGNLANLLTLSRIAMIPAVLLFLWIPETWAAWTSWAIYSLAGFTDWFDGWVARTRGESSDLGRFLDPIADKLLVASLLMALVALRRIDGWWVMAALVILCREILVSGLREFLAGLRVGVPVSQLAKWKTGVQMVAIGTLIVGDYGPSWLATRLLGEIGLGIAAALTLVTGYDYLRAGLRHMDPAAPSPGPGAKAR